jgi:hypothetical protein
MHVSLYLALFQYWNFNRFQNPFPVYRDNIMELSKIGSKNTYHKSIRVLHQTGYIIYHAAPSKYLPVKISIIRLDTKEPPAIKQLDLFKEQQTSIGEKAHPPLEGDSGGVHVPHLTDTGINNDTQQVPDLGQYIKQENILKNSVSNTPTQPVENNAAMKKENPAPHVPNLRHIPSIQDVETFFLEHHKDANEAHKFFYYNQSKNWMLTDKIPIYNWQALAHKWMINDRINVQELQMNFDKEIQFLYEKFFYGEKINKLLLPEYADHLQLEVTSATMEQAKQRRVNQLSGSNERTEIHLWKAYMDNSSDDELLTNDQPNLIALAKKLTVLKYFQKLKSKGQTKIKQDEH